MKFYKVLDDGKFGGEIELESSISPIGYTDINPGYNFYGLIFVDGKWVNENSIATPEPPSFKLSKLAFKKRFPPAKWIAAKIAAQTNIPLSDFFEDFMLASYVNLEDPRTQYGVMSLVDPAVPVEFRLTQEEADAILLIPSQPGDGIYE